MSKVNLFPALRYADPDAALAFLRDAFGFTEVAVHRGPDGAIQHVELQLDGGGMIMLGAGETGAGSLTLYAVVADPDAHCERARAAGATVVEEPTDRDYGSREYQATDPGGVVWCFGTYDPCSGAS